MLSVLRGPKFSLLAYTTLRLEDVQEGFKTHDLSLAAVGESPPSYFLLLLVSHLLFLTPLQSPRGRRLLATTVWQCVLPPGRSASLHDAASHQRAVQGSGT